MSETAGEQLARLRVEEEQRRRLEEPMTRGDVLFALDLVVRWGLNTKQLREQLAQRWGIHV